MKTSAILLVDLEDLANSAPLAVRSVRRASSSLRLCSWIRSRAASMSDTSFCAPTTKITLTAYPCLPRRCLVRSTPRLRRAKGSAFGRLRDATRRRELDFPQLVCSSRRTPRVDGFHSWSEAGDGSRFAPAGRTRSRWGQGALRRNPNPRGDAVRISAEAVVDPEPGTPPPRNGIAPIY